MSIYEKIRDKYNKLIEQCKSENYESIKDKHCKLKSPYLNRFKSYYNPPNNNSNNENSKNELSDILCGCRFSSKIFLSELNKKTTFKKSFDMYSQNPIIQNMIRTYRQTNSSDEVFPQYKEGIFLIQIYQYYEEVNGYSPAHSFVMDKKGSQCHILSSWYGGGSQSSTPVMYTMIEESELYELLNHLNKQTKDQQETLFGENNYFKDNEKIIVKYLDIRTIQQPKRNSYNSRKNNSLPKSKRTRKHNTK